MGTFYILPPRELLEQTLGDLLGRFLPGLSLPVDSWEVVVERLASAAQWPEDVYLIPRDDLPEGVSSGEALITIYGAEPGDRVVEVNSAKSSPRMWVLAQADVSGVATAR